MTLTDLDDVFRTASVPAWTLCLVVMFPPVVRFLAWRGRHLDAIWAVVFLLALNRLSFLLHVSLALSHASAAVFAVTMTLLSIWYQRHDA